MAIKNFLLVAFVSLLLPTVSNAGIIWDNGPSNPHNHGANFSEGRYKLADDIALSAATVLRSVQFWGVHWNSGKQPATERFTASIYKNNHGQVGSLLARSDLSLFAKEDTGFDHNRRRGADILEFTMNLVSPIALASGGYWFSVVSANNRGTNFAWQESGRDGTGNFQVTYGGKWQQRRNALAFNLSNQFAGFAGHQIPEPGSVALIGLGLIGLALTRRRSRQAAQA